MTFAGEDLLSPPPRTKDTKLNCALSLSTQEIVMNKPASLGGHLEPRVIRLMRFELQKEKGKEVVMKEFIIPRGV